MALVTIHFKAVDQLLLIHCLLLLPLFWGFQVCHFRYVVLCVLSSFAVILLRKTKLVADFDCLPGVLLLLVIGGIFLHCAMGWSVAWELGIS